jgi:hypothetical protein
MPLRHAFPLTVAAMHVTETLKASLEVLPPPYPTSIPLLRRTYKVDFM